MRHELLVIAGVLSMFLLWWVIGYRQYVKMLGEPADADIVYVDAKQWMWKFAYSDGRTSNDVLTVPVGRPIKLVMTSRDVIHSFFVPAFRVKQDVVPGQMTTLWFEATREGTYPNQCTEYCGRSHSTKRGEVVAVSDDEFDRLTRAAGSGDLASRGEKVAIERGCARCHSVDGSLDLGPTWAGLYGSRVRLASGLTVVADEAYLTRSMMDPMAEIHVGFSPVMPSFRGQLSATETAALVEYIRSLADRTGEGTQ
jgi:cytochrome c oxidase subunit 2